MIRKHGGLVTSILTSHTRAASGWRRVYIRIGDLPRTELRALEGELRKQADLLYMIEDDLAASACFTTGS